LLVHLPLQLMTSARRSPLHMLKADIALHGNPISDLWDVTCHMRSHSVTCHPTQWTCPA